MPFGPCSLNTVSGGITPHVLHHGLHSEINLSPPLTSVFSLFVTVVPGTSYLELMGDSVAFTGVPPRDLLAAGGRESTAPRFWSGTFSVRMLVHDFVEPISASWNDLAAAPCGQRHKKVFSRRCLHVDSPRHGLLYLLYSRNGHDVGLLLCDVLQHDSVDRLQQYIKEYTGPKLHDMELQKTWSSLITARSTM